MSASHGSVVVAIDHHQPTALSFAAEEARREGTTLRVVHVAPVPIQTAGFVLGREELQALRVAGRAILAAAREHLEQESDPPPVDYILDEGLVLARLEAEAKGARMLVLGTDRLSWVERLLRTPVAARLVGRADCPVVVVPERPDHTPLSGGVVIALDGRTAATGPLTFAFEQAARRDHVLHVLHAGPSSTDRTEADAHRANLAEVLAGWSETYPDVRVLTSQTSDEAGAACARATEQAELVVLGHVDAPRIPFVSRPVAKQVLASAHCPVAVVPTAYTGSRSS